MSQATIAKTKKATPVKKRATPKKKQKLSASEPTLKNLIVKIRHWRRVLIPTETSPFQKIEMIPMAKIRQNKVGSPYVLLERGGKTELSIYTPDGTHLVSSTAECSEKDNYDRKKGVKVCMSRIFRPA